MSTPTTVARAAPEERPNSTVAVAMATSKRFDAPIIADGVTHGDDGEITAVGRAWWFPDYAVRSEIDDLWKSGRV